MPSGPKTPTPMKTVVAGYPRRAMACAFVVSMLVSEIVLATGALHEDVEAITCSLPALEKAYLSRWILKHDRQRSSVTRQLRMSAQK
ncbi:hypothetical protein BESB_079310 [Besnoitia besnoiti]|uniref:Uncharacterized protein n=1 Tax=Besnoitia besnoiti TaxID=94643 RepID=A0A2A9M6U2_BESBE|nr:hypothetical protein BESB_079310 [Besnoitia besnoiti]PFH33715.1 hypothetical protein BESB_079310 [Besnoitia besnoiti]